MQAGGSGGVYSYGQGAPPLAAPRRIELNYLTKFGGAFVPCLPLPSKSSEGFINVPPKVRCIRDELLINLPSSECPPSQGLAYFFSQ